MKNQPKIIIGILVALGVASIAVLLQPPIAQPLEYHDFADDRLMLGVPNLLNVISNLPFVIVGAMGLYSLLVTRKIRGLSQFQSGYLVLFLGLFLVGFGSGYYHLSPGNPSLVWDRLPMTLAFMALFAIIIAEYLSARVGRLLLYPFIVLGCWSVLHWHFSELSGSGDLRYYILVQFLPLIAIVLFLLYLKPTYSHRAGYWWLILCYGLAKIFEYYDTLIFDLLHVVSGHSLKHLVAGLGMLLLLNSYKQRRLVVTEKIQQD